MSQRTLLGMITPSSNTVLEPMTSLMLADLFPEVTAHFSRFKVTEISLDPSALDQFELGPIIASAKLLADALPSSISWNGTSASWLGFERDKALCLAIESETGVPATSSVLALNELIEKNNIERIGLITPYLDDVQKKIIENYHSIGVHCVSEVHFKERNNYAFSEFSEADIEYAIRDLANNKPQAIIILCTNLRAARLVTRLEAEIGIPIYDSVAAVVWKALRLAGVRTDALAEDWGSVFTQQD